MKNTSFQRKNKPKRRIGKSVALGDETCTAVSSTTMDERSVADKAATNEESKKARKKKKKEKRERGAGIEDSSSITVLRPKKKSKTRQLPEMCKTSAAISSNMSTQNSLTPESCTSKVAEYETQQNENRRSATRAPKRERKDKMHRSPDEVSLAKPEASSGDDFELNETASSLEGIIHVGKMYLVDVDKRAFSSTRDELGRLIQVGILDVMSGSIRFNVDKSMESRNNADSTDWGGTAGISEPCRGFGDTNIHPGTKSEVTRGEGEACGKSALVSEAKKKSMRRRERRKKKRQIERGAAKVVEAEAIDVRVQNIDGAINQTNTEGNGRGPAVEDSVQVVEYPFEVDECDHCETSEQAYADIAPLLISLAKEIGKEPEELAIYDPFYCQGSAVERLKSVGFPNVYNRKEDFYQILREEKLPEHDVVVTNPPFSGDHLANILRFCARQGGRPWFLLLPNYVYLKDYYEPSLTDASSGQSLLPLYLTPAKRYTFYSPKGSRLNVKSGERKTSPFNTLWYIHLGDRASTSKILQQYNAMLRTKDPEERCCVARTTAQIPYKMMDSNDPRRKKARDRQRSMERIRAKKNAWIQ